MMHIDTQPLLSRVAEAVYWTARYIERAENVARYIGVNLALQLDLPLEPASQWQPLIDTSGDTEAFAKRYGEATQSNVIEFLAYDSRNHNSIYSCLRAARENARSIRETIGSEMWEQINSLYLRVSAQREKPAVDWPADVFGSIRLGCHLFQGIADATMTHNEAWHFLRLGRKLERADQTSRILDVKFFMLLPSLGDVGTPYDDILWSAVLKSVSGFEMYRKKYGRIEPNQIVEFLVMDREFPRAIHFCIRHADESLHQITGTPMGAFGTSSEQLMGRLRSELDFASVEGIIDQGLHEYLDALQTRISLIGESLVSDFIAPQPQQYATRARGVRG